MIVNAPALRARRMELGLTTREVARRANVSQAVVKRIEETADVSVLRVATLEAILACLSLDLVEVLEGPTRRSADSPLAARIGSLLHERRRGVQSHDIAMTLAATLDEVEDALGVLDAELRPAGLRLARGATGVRIVGQPDPDAGSGSEQERQRHLANLNAGDLALLYRVLTRRVPANTVAATNDGNVSLRKLEGAGLVETIAREVQLTSGLQRTLLEGREALSNHVRRT